MVKAFVPRTWQKIQDWTHLILILGVIACIVLVVRTIIAFANGSCFELFCVEEVLALVFIVPCIFYVIKIIGQYDDRLTSKQRDCKEQKANLTKTYNSLLTDMDDLLANATES